MAAKDYGIVPLADRIVVEPLEVEDTTPGGIVLPDVAKRKSHRGRVLAVGNGRRLETLSGDGRVPVEVAEGDMVVYPPHSGHDFPFKGRTLKILEESDILARLT